MDNLLIITIDIFQAINYNIIMERKEIIKDLRNKRYTYRQIGRLLGISFQRVHQILTGYNSSLPSPITYINPKWKPNNKIENGGIEKLEGRDFIREKVRRRDNWTCQICGIKWVKGQRRFDIHHINGNKEKTRKYDKYKELKDLITLCHKCHKRIDEHRKVGRNLINNVLAF